MSAFKIKCWVCHRLKEPSTWAALSVPLATLGTQLEHHGTYAYIVAAICTCIAIILGEKSNADSTDSNPSVSEQQSGNPTVGSFRAVMDSNRVGNTPSGRNSKNPSGKRSPEKPKAGRQSGMPKKPKNH